MLIIWNIVSCMALISTMSPVLGLGFFESIGKFVGYAEENHVQLTNEQYFNFLINKEIANNTALSITNATANLAEVSKSFSNVSNQSSVQKVAISTDYTSNEDNEFKLAIITTDSVNNTSSLYYSSPSGQPTDIGQSRENQLEETENDDNNLFDGKNLTIVDADNLVTRVSLSSPNLFTNSNNTSFHNDRENKNAIENTNNTTHLQPISSLSYPYLPKSMLKSDISPQYHENVFTIEYQNNGDKFATTSLNLSILRLIIFILL